MTGLAAAGRQAETIQIKEDREFAGLQQQREVEVSDAKKRLANILKNQSRSDIPTAENRSSTRKTEKRYTNSTAYK